MASLITVSAVDMADDSDTLNLSAAMKTVQKNSKLCRKHLGRGVVYIKNIPHGFYEEEMKHFFRQFGTITHIVLARSKTSGKSKGFAYIEFLYRDIAKIVADTMNNYLMAEKLLKTKFIPSEQFNVGLFYRKHPTEKNYPHKKNRKKNTDNHNSDVPLMGVMMKQKKLEESHSRLMENLENEGIKFEFQVGNMARVDVEYEDEPFLDDPRGPVMVLDDSDDEIEFKVPTNVILKEKKTGYLWDPSKPSTSKDNYAVADPGHDSLLDDAEGCIGIDNAVPGPSHADPGPSCKRSYIKSALQNRRKRSSEAGEPAVVIIENDNGVAEKTYVIDVEDDILEGNITDIEGVEFKIRTFLTSLESSMQPPKLLLTGGEVGVIHKALKLLRKKKEKLNASLGSPSKPRRPTLLNSLKKKKQKQQEESWNMKTRSRNRLIDPSISQIKKRTARSRE